MRKSPFAGLGARLTSLIKGFACRLSKPKIRISPNSRTTTRKKGNNIKNGLCTLMEELAYRKVKPQLVWAPSPALPVEGYISCLVRSVQLKRILRVQELGSIPTTLLNSGVLLRHYLALDPMALSPAIHKPVSSTTPSTRPTFAWVRFSHARMSPWV